jgi:signal transduction histidine kinase
MKLPNTPWTPFEAPAEPELLRRQESVLVVLNLTVLAGIAVAFLVFGGVGLAGPPGKVFFAILMAWFLVQALALVWLVGNTGATRGVPLAAWASLSIWVNLAFAFALALSGGMEDTHTAVLLVIPVIAAAFRYAAAGVVVVVAAAVGITYFQLWIYYRHLTTVATTEYFEATNAAMVYVVVAIVVASLVRHLRRDAESLKVSFLELQATKDRLVREEKLAAVGRLAGAIAHEVRNPVTMIVSALQLATDETVDASKRGEWFGIASDEARRLETLTRDFLTYARQKEPDRQPIALSTVVGYVAGLARARESATGVGLHVACPVDATVHVDAFQIHGALLNLLFNALDATPSGGEVLLGADAEPGGGARLWVENPGPAIPPDVVPRLFEPFFTTRPRGTGLGLAIARTTARSHGGDVDLTTNEDGKVRFTLRIPSVPGAER